MRHRAGLRRTRRTVRSRLRSRHAAVEETRAAKEIYDFAVDIATDDARETRNDNDENPAWELYVYEKAGEVLDQLRGEMREPNRRTLVWLPSLSDRVELSESAFSRAEEEISGMVGYIRKAMKDRGQSPD